MSPAIVGFAVIRCVLGAWAIYLPGEIFATYRNTYGAAWDTLAFTGWRCVQRGALQGGEDRFERIPNATPCCIDCGEPVNQALYGLVFRHPRCEAVETVELAPDPDELPEVLA